MQVRALVAKRRAGVQSILDQSVDEQAMLADIDQLADVGNPNWTPQHECKAAFFAKKRVQKQKALLKRAGQEYFDASGHQ